MRERKGGWKERKEGRRKEGNEIGRKGVSIRRISFNQIAMISIIR